MEQNIKTREETPSLNILENVYFNFKMSLHIWSYLGYIITSDKVCGHFPTENLKGISKVSLLFIQAVKGDEKLQITKWKLFYGTPSM